MNKLFCLIVLFFIIAIPALAGEKILLKITPEKVISTHHDGIEVGDYIKFKVVNDVYYREKLYISKDSTVVGIVSNVHENGYFCDNAEIIITPFKVKTFNNKVITINSTLTLNRKDFVCKTFGDKVVKYVGVIFRGNEIKIDPYSIEYNIFLIK